MIFEWKRIARQIPRARQLTYFLKHYSSIALPYALVNELYWLPTLDLSTWSDRYTNSHAWNCFLAAPACACTEYRSLTPPPFESLANFTRRPYTMASESADGLEPILTALNTMQANAERTQKSQAHGYLERFQKSVCTSMQIGHARFGPTDSSFSLRLGPRHIHCYRLLQPPPKPSCSLPPH